MASSEVVDSGRFSAGKSSSNFSQTCNLLSRYLKEKGSFGDLNLGFTQTFESKGAPTGTMNLFPITEKSGQNPGKDETLKISDLSESKLGGEPAQMTIFYGGQVLVFNDFPSEKAKEIITLASKSSAAAAVNHRSTAFTPVETTATNIQNIAPAFGLLELAHSSPQPTLASSDLPIARKNSLARFLEKRKDRISASAPYQAKKTEATVKAEPWLGLEMNRH